MNKLVARLIDCGMTRSVALCVLRRFPDLRSAEEYVEQIILLQHYDAMLEAIKSAKRRLR